MQRGPPDSTDEQCRQISSSQLLALHNSEIEQLATIVLAQQQCQPLFHSSNTKKHMLDDIHLSHSYSQAEPQHLYTHLNASHIQHHDENIIASSSGASILQNGSTLNVAALESPQYLAHRLLVEFGKTRTNYNSLVPRIVEIIRMFRDYGPLQCPLPVVSNLDELLNDEALTHIEQRYPNSIDAGFLVLCTERRALRSGGGGKYYFIDTSGRLVGCHKSELPSYVEKGVLRGPVLLKNLIFVFILRGAFGLDPRCKSSNPQRLLEFYENLSKEGKVSDIQRLVRVWSMEIYPEAPYDNGFPPCTLLWVKRMHVSSHISKWKHSQWHTNHYRGHDFHTNSPLSTSLTGTSSLGYLPHRSMDRVPQDVVYQFEGVASEELQSGPLSLSCNSKRRRLTDTSLGIQSNVPPYNCWGAPSSFSTMCISSMYDGNNPSKRHDKTFIASNYLTDYEPHQTDNDLYNVIAPPHGMSWELETIQKLYSEFSEFSSRLQKADVMDWSVQVIDRLSPPVLEAAIYLISTTLRVQNTGSEFPCSMSGDTAKGLRYDILRILCDVKERGRMIEGLRILIACLLQQQRLEELLPGSFVKEECESGNISTTSQCSSTKTNLSNTDPSHQLFPEGSLQCHCLEIEGRSFSRKTTTITTTSTTATETESSEIEHWEECFVNLSKFPPSDHDGLPNNDFSDPFVDPTNVTGEIAYLSSNAVPEAENKQLTQYYVKNLEHTTVVDDALTHTAPESVLQNDSSDTHQTVHINDNGKRGKMEDEQHTQDQCQSKQSELPLLANQYKLKTDDLQYLIVHHSEAAAENSQQGSIFDTPSTHLFAEKKNSNDPSCLALEHSNDTRVDYSDSITLHKDSGFLFPCSSTITSTNEKDILYPAAELKSIQGSSSTSQETLWNEPSSTLTTSLLDSTMAHKGLCSLPSMKDNPRVPFHNLDWEDTITPIEPPLEKNSWVAVEHWTEGDDTVNETEKAFASDGGLFVNENFPDSKSVPSSSCARATMVFSVLCAPTPH